MPDFKIGDRVLLDFDRFPFTTNTKLRRLARLRRPATVTGIAAGGEVIIVFDRIKPKTTPVTAQLSGTFLEFAPPGAKAIGDREVMRHQALRERP